MFTFVHRAQCFEMSPQSKLCLHFAATCLRTLVRCIREYKLTAVNFLIDVGIITRSLRSLGCCDTMPKEILNISGLILPAPLLN